MAVVVGSFVAKTLYGLARNDWVIDLKRWNPVWQFRAGKRDETTGDDR